MRSFILILALALSVVAGHAAQTAKITVAKPGSYYYWFTYADVGGKEVTTAPAHFGDKTTTVELPLVKDAVPKSTLLVLDETTANEAVIPVSGKPPFKFALKPADFDRVRRIEILVVSSTTGEPAAAAIVKLGAGDKKPRVQVLDPSAQGIVQFLDVPSGTAKVVVEYGDGKSMSQDVEIALEREQRITRVQIPVVGEIETVRAPGTSGGGKGESKQPTLPINFPLALVGLILFAIVLWLAARMMRNRGAGFRQILKKVGIELPGEPEPESGACQPAPGAPVDSTICPFCGMKKDPNTGACACSLETAPAAAGGSGPRLVAVQGPYAGTIYALDADAVSIGREETNAISFPQDSAVSRKHARIEKADGGIKIVDEGSSNGTFVNGVKVSDQVLSPGDEVQIGTTRMRFEA